MKELQAMQKMGLVSENSFSSMNLDSLRRENMGQVKQSPRCTDLSSYLHSIFLLFWSDHYCSLLYRIKRCDVRLLNLLHLVSWQFIEVQSTGKQNLANSWHILLYLWVFVRLSARNDHPRKRCSERRLWTQSRQKPSGGWCFLSFTESRACSYASGKPWCFSRYLMEERKGFHLRATSGLRWKA